MSNCGDMPKSRRAARAIAEGDGKLLKQLGRELQSKGSGPQPHFDHVDLWLVGAWLPQGKSRFGLCHAKDECITDFCQIATGNGSITTTMITKRRQRLGLVKHPDKSKYVTGVRSVNGKAVFSFR